MQLRSTKSYLINFYLFCSPRCCERKGMGMHGVWEWMKMHLHLFHRDGGITLRTFPCQLLPKTSSNCRVLAKLIWWNWVPCLPKQMFCHKHKLYCFSCSTAEISTNWKDLLVIYSSFGAKNWTQNLRWVMRLWMQKYISISEILSKNLILKLFYTM